jgi:hypothetical protein
MHHAESIVHTSRTKSDIFANLEIKLGPMHFQICFFSKMFHPITILAVRVKCLTSLTMNHQVVLMNVVKSRDFHIH